MINHSQFKACHVSNCTVLSNSQTCSNQFCRLFWALKWGGWTTQFLKYFSVLLVCLTMYNKDFRGNNQFALSCKTEKCFTESFPTSLISLEENSSVLCRTHRLNRLCWFSRASSARTRLGPLVGYASREQRRGGCEVTAFLWGVGGEGRWHHSPPA